MNYKDTTIREYFENLKQIQKENSEKKLKMYCINIDDHVLTGSIENGKNKTRKSKLYMKRKMIPHGELKLPQNPRNPFKFQIDALISKEEVTRLRKYDWTL